MEGELVEGIENYNKAIAFGYASGDIFYNLGLVYEEDNDYIIHQLILKMVMESIVKEW